MQLDYYSLPLALNQLTGKHDLPKCSLKQSVNQHLYLILTTSFDEFKCDPSFGCAIWDNDFDNVTSGHKVKENIRQSLLQSIQQYEKRISGVRVELMIVQEELPDSRGATRRVKKKIDITISSILKLTNEKHIYRDSFFLGPYSR
jgi:phage baseplate assembly protein W